MEAHSWRRSLAVPVNRPDPPALSRVKWTPEGRPTEKQRRDWRDRATRMIDTAEGIPEGHKARMIAVLRLFATRCDSRGEVLINLTSVTDTLRDYGYRMSVPTVRRAVRDLERYGYLDVEPHARPWGAQTGNVYRLRPFLDADEGVARAAHDERPPLSTCNPTKPYHGDTPSSSSFSDTAASRTPSAAPVRRAAAESSTTTSTTVPTTSAVVVDAFRAAGLTNPEDWAQKVAHLPERGVLAKVDQAKSKGNPGGWLRNALSGMQTDPTPAPEAPRLTTAQQQARSAAGTLYGLAVNGRPMSRAEALTAITATDAQHYIAENLSAKARQHLDGYLDAILTEKGHR